MIPAAIASRKYLPVGIVTMVISGVTATYPSFDGIKCQSALNSTSKPVGPRPILEEAAGNNFLIRNSYVYSFFGVIAGISLLSVSASKRTKSQRSR